MKATLLNLAISGLFSSSLFAEPNLKEEVALQKDRLSQAIKDGTPGVYPGLIERLDRLFLQYPITHIVITSISKEGKKKSTEIYIRGEEVYVTQADDGWNLVANSNGVFEWEEGKRDGLKIKRSNRDLAAYLEYLTDPAGVVSSLYGQFLASPDRFTIVHNNAKKWMELRPKTPLGPFEALYVSEKPLWFHGLRAKDETGQTKEMMISEPKELQELPEKCAEHFKAIKFEASDLSLKRHMIFL